MSNENSDLLDSYEQAINQYKKVFMSAYEEGLKDGSVKEQDDINLFYFSTTHALIELCKKLSAKAVLNQDLEIEKTSEIKYMVKLVLSLLSK